MNPSPRVLTVAAISEVCCVRRWERGDLLLTVVGWLALMPMTGLAQGGWWPGQSVSWQRAQSGFTPGDGAIVGGPGNDPSPGAPMYVCRGQDGGSLVPGKWVRGNCNVAFGNREDVLQNYEVAFGTARWGSYQGSTAGLVQMGYEPDRTPLYSCRVMYSSRFPPQDLGYQPGKLVRDGTCHFPLGGGEIAQGPPFDVLYAGGGGYPPYPAPPSPPAPLPGCRLTDPGVTLQDGLWVGPNCAPSDGLGNAAGQPPINQAPVGPYQPGPSSVSWQHAQSPFTPGQGAIEGGPGNGPKAGAPLYVCRAPVNGALLPGKWIEGQCSVSFAGKEQKLNSYEVANGNAAWRNFDGDVGALVPGGFDSDGTPLYVCRVHVKVFGDKGMQPGRLRGGQCLVPYAGSGMSSAPPFEALYNVFSSGGGSSGAPAPNGASAPVAGGGGAPTGPGAVAPSTEGIQVSFLHGTGDAAGTVTVTNGANGKSVTEPIAPNSTPEQCVAALQQAAFAAGLQIQAGPDGKGLRVSGINNSVSATGAAIAVSQY